MRYKFYREHKYLRFKFDELERLAAKADFRKDEEVIKVKEEFERLIKVLKAHAQYEDDLLHVLLIRKNSTIHEEVEAAHDRLDEQIESLRDMLNKIGHARTPQEKIEGGDQFHLWYRKFSAGNLLHLHEEEVLILPELHRLYSDEELRKVDASIYTTMTEQELLDMVKELFPHMNSIDWEHFLTDIKDAVPAKFMMVWNGIKSMMTSDQQKYFIEKLSITN